MQNFDFNSLYDNNLETGRSVEGSLSPPKGDFQGTFSEFSSKKMGQKSRVSGSNKSFYFLSALALTFMLGIWVGVELVDSPEVESTGQAQGDSVASAQKGSSSPQLATKDKDSQAKASGRSHKFFVKVYPQLKPSKARHLAKSMLQKDLSLFYSKLTDGDYYLYIGPYNHRLSAEKAVAQLNNAPYLEGADQYQFKIVQRKKKAF